MSKKEKPEFTPPKCECGEDMNFDPHTRIWYCQVCDPQFHKEVQRDILEEKRRKVREEYQDTVMDNMD